MRLIDGAEAGLSSSVWLDRCSNGPVASKSTEALQGSLG